MKNTGMNMAQPDVTRYRSQPRGERIVQEAAMSQRRIGARQKQRISFPLISALYIHPGDPAYSCAHSGLCIKESNETRMRQSRELIIPDWSISACMVDTTGQWGWADVWRHIKINQVVLLMHKTQIP